MKVCYTLSYKSPHYVRTQYLLQLMDKMPNVEVLRAINTHKGVARYFETIAKLISIRILEKPDVYILGFRGTEIYWLVRLITVGKPLIFDEFLNPYLWMIEEHAKLKPKWLFGPMVSVYEKFILRTADAILSDTKLHARYSYENFGGDPDKFTTIYVGTDENTWQKHNVKRDPKKFKVFFYGTVLPLHGFETIIEAAGMLGGRPIEITLVGGANKKAKMKKLLQEIKSRNLTNVVHLPWVEWGDLPRYVSEADLCLGGPFGGTPQGKRVITGKTFQFMSIAKPVLIGKIDEDVGFVDKKNCLIVDQASPKDLAEAIVWAYENRSKLEKIGERAGELYWSRFSQEAQTNILAEVIDHVRGSINTR